MSKTQRSSSRTHSRSPSRCRSHSNSRSGSRSRSSSRSRSRSRKYRYSSRSHSRSRSHSPAHNRERKHPRDFQNHREFRGYHRGFRRPYYFRGRGRGFFRGRFQRGGGGGGGGGGYNNRSNNWQHFRQHPQQKQQQKQQQQYNHMAKSGCSRSRSPKRTTSSPPKSRSHSRRSDRSSSPHSHHSSSSNSSRQRSDSTKRICKASNEGVPASKECQLNGGDETLEELKECPAEAKRSASGGQDPDTCQDDNSPKRASPNANATVSACQSDPGTSKIDSVPVSSGATGNGATCWQTVTSTPPNNSLSKKSPTTVFSSLGLFSDANQPDEDTIAISIAFKKFLEEQKSKKQAVTENGIQKAASNGEAMVDKKNSKSEGIFDHPSCFGVSKTAAHSEKRQSEKCIHDDSIKAAMPSNSFLNRPKFLCEDGNEEEEGKQTESHLQMRDLENAAPDRKGKVAPSACELSEEHFGSLEDFTWDDKLMAFLINRKKERAASFLAAPSKREKLARKFRDLSPGRPPKIKQKETTTLSPSPTYEAVSRRSSESQEQEMFLNMSDESPLRASGKRGTEFSLRMDSLSDDLARSSVLSNDWRNAMDPLHPDIKEQEFNSVCQHLPCNNLRRSPSEFFAQHVVAIVHHIKAHYFPSSGMTLNDRFAMYQRIAAEKEIKKQRKSPEIHRRIDVSPSSFKRHSLLFDELKSSVDSSFKVNGKHLKGETVDLRLDIERRKKFLFGQTNDKQEGAESGGSESGVERPNEKSSKYHKRTKKNKRKRERTHSSSSSSSISHEEEGESMEEDFTQAQQQLTECSVSTEKGQTRGGFQFKIRSRGWNRVNSLANNTNNNSNTYMPVQSKNEDWNPEDILKSRKYFLQDKKEGEGEKKWAEPRGRGQANVPRVKGRFILRRPTCSITTSNCNWSYGKFQAGGEDNEQSGNTMQNHKEQNNT